VALNERARAVGRALLCGLAGAFVVVAAVIDTAGPVSATTTRVQAEGSGWTVAAGTWTVNSGGCCGSDAGYTQGVATSDVSHTFTVLSGETAGLVLGIYPAGGSLNWSVSGPVLTSSSLTIASTGSSFAAQTLVSAGTLTAGSYTLRLYGFAGGSNYAIDYFEVQGATIPTTTTTTAAPTTTTTAAPTTTTTAAPTTTTTAAPTQVLVMNSRLPVVLWDDDTTVEVGAAGGFSFGVGFMLFVRHFMKGNEQI